MSAETHACDREMETPLLQNGEDEKPVMKKISLKGAKVMENNGKKKKRKRAYAVASVRRKKTKCIIGKRVPFNISSLECGFCKEGDNNEEVYRGTFFRNEEENIAAHQFCLLFSCGLPQLGSDSDGFEGFLFEDIRKEMRRASRIQCVFCGESGASSGCAVKACLQVYHYNCGTKNNIQFDFHGKFNTSCARHRSYQDMSSLLNGSRIPSCPICLDDIENDVNVLKMPCCKNVFSHKSCIQRQAISSGYFFKCPTCKNEEQFKREMAKYGVYIPQRDAEWEEDNAFSDLLEQYKNCDIPNCKCPMGSGYEDEHGDWELIRCYHCGQGAVHSACLGGRAVKKYGYVCRDCNDATGVVKRSTFLAGNCVQQTLGQKKLIDERVASGDPLVRSALWERFGLQHCTVCLLRMPEALVKFIETVESKRRSGSSAKEEENAMAEEGVSNDSDIAENEDDGNLNTSIFISSQQLSDALFWKHSSSLPQRPQISSIIETVDLSQPLPLGSKKEGEYTEILNTDLHCPPQPSMTVETLDPTLHRFKFDVNIKHNEDIKHLADVVEDINNAIKQGNSKGFNSDDGGLNLAPPLLADSVMGDTSTSSTMEATLPTHSTAQIHSPAKCTFSLTAALDLATVDPQAHSDSSFTESTVQIVSTSTVDSAVSSSLLSPVYSSPLVESTLQTDLITPEGSEVQVSCSPVEPTLQMECAYAAPVDSIDVNSVPSANIAHHPDEVTKQADSRVDLGLVPSANATSHIDIALEIQQEDGGPPSVDSCKSDTTEGSYKSVDTDQYHTANSSLALSSMGDDSFPAYALQRSIQTNADIIEVDLGETESLCEDMDGIDTVVVKTEPMDSIEMTNEGIGTVLNNEGMTSLQMSTEGMGSGEIYTEGIGSYEMNTSAISTDTMHSDQLIAVKSEPINEIYPDPIKDDAPGIPIDVERVQDESDSGVLLVKTVPPSTKVSPRVTRSRRALSTPDECALVARSRITYYLGSNTHIPDVNSTVKGKNRKRKRKQKSTPPTSKTMLDKWLYKENQNTPPPPLLVGDAPIEPPAAPPVTPPSNSITMSSDDNVVLLTSPGTLRRSKYPRILLSKCNTTL